MTPRYPGLGAAYVEFPVELASMAAAAQEDEGQVNLIAATELPMERYGPTPDGGWGMWREQLDHSAAAVQLDRLASGRAPLLVEHFRGDQIGVVTSAALVNRRLKVSARFSNSARGQEYLQDVRDAIRRSVSIGYSVKRARLVEQNDELGDLWRITSWEPFEVSLVSVPANPEARVASGRAFSSSHAKEAVMPPLKNPNATPGVAVESAAAAAEPETMALRIEVADDPPDPQEQARREAAEIFGIASKYGQAAKAADWINRGLTLNEVKGEILAMVKTGTRSDSPMPSTASKSTADDIGLNGKERRRYSYARAIHMGAGLRDGTEKLSGLEGEMHRELEKRRPSNIASQGGLLVPLDLRSEDEIWAAQSRQAALDAKTLTKGAELVFDQQGELIELLRNRAAVISMGARVLTGLSGPTAFPKQTGAISAQWVAENPSVDVTASDLALGLVTLFPKTLQASTSYSRQLVATASISIESIVRNDLARVHAIAIDRASIHGSGTNGEPTGIYQVPNVNVKAMGGQATFPNLLSAAGQVGDKNADDGSLGWITTALIAYGLRGIPEHATAGVANFIWQGQPSSGTIMGYPARATNNVSKTMTGSAPTGGSEHGMIFGNWADLLIGLWDAMEIIPDPFALKKRGMIEVTSFQMADLVIRHPESFCKTTGLTP